MFTDLPDAAQDKLRKRRGLRKEFVYVETLFADEDQVEGGNDDESGGHSAGSSAVPVAPAVAKYTGGCRSRPSGQRSLLAQGCNKTGVIEGQDRIRAPPGFKRPGGANLLPRKTCARCRPDWSRADVGPPARNSPKTTTYGPSALKTRFPIWIAGSLIFDTDSCLRINVLSRCWRLGHGVPTGRSKTGASTGRFRQPPKAGISRQQDVPGKASRLGTALEIAGNASGRSRTAEECGGLSTRVPHAVVRRHCGRRLSRPRIA